MEELQNIFDKYQKCASGWLRCRRNIEVLFQSLKAELEAVTAENQTLKEHKDIMALALCNMQRDINLLKGGNDD